MRHTELWERLEHALGRGYARAWASQHVLTGLDNRTVDQALADGEPAKTVWRAVWKELDRPASER